MKFEVFVYGENNKISLTSLSSDLCDYSYGGIIGGKLNNKYALFVFDDNDLGVLRKIEFVTKQKAIEYALA